MTKSQLSSQLKAASREGLLPLNGCLSYTYELPTLAVEAAASAAAAKVKVKAEVGTEEEEEEENVGGGGHKFGDACYNEGQVVWVRGAFVAYMDGQAVEDDDVWCPGVVCAAANSAASSPAEANGGDGAVASPGGLVVDVMGQSKVEFAVGTDNLTGFPGYGDNLEAFRHSVATGLGNPPDHMCLAVAQAILACLKCGWDPARGTNLFRPALCNEQREGDARLGKYATAWGVDPDRLEELLKYSWALMKPNAQKSKKADGDQAGSREEEEEEEEEEGEGEWDHLRATWRKLENMWRGAKSAAHDEGSVSRGGDGGGAADSGGGSGSGGGGGGRGGGSDSAVSDATSNGGSGSATTGVDADNNATAKKGTVAAGTGDDGGDGSEPGGELPPPPPPPRPPPAAAAAAEGGVAAPTAATPATPVPSAAASPPPPVPRALPPKGLVHRSQQGPRLRRNQPRLSQALLPLLLLLLLLSRQSPPNPVQVGQRPKRAIAEIARGPGRTRGTRPTPPGVKQQHPSPATAQLRQLPRLLPLPPPPQPDVLCR
ncbi:expressed unknown protein [Ectocarpus siliculosus]|uniref:Uncharacterized protein n=1 Tax=Ectocarpus siliculosus TaxID=2880 RepID=D7FJW9_ECTSI|nr:expressed unknown protein [Ectocarpus siliculosus]|eukprot:CBJ29217.1 expressed unknown protein [Ectocarpus siliculosus]